MSVSILSEEELVLDKQVDVAVTEAMGKEDIGSLSQAQQGDLRQKLVRIVLVELCEARLPTSSGIATVLLYIACAACRTLAREARSSPVALENPPDAGIHSAERAREVGGQASIEGERGGVSQEERIEKREEGEELPLISSLPEGGIRRGSVAVETPARREEAGDVASAVADGRTRQAQGGGGLQAGPSKEPGRSGNDENERILPKSPSPFHERAPPNFYPQQQYQSQQYQPQQYQPQQYQPQQYRPQQYQPQQRQRQQHRDDSRTNGNSRRDDRGWNDRGRDRRHRGGARSEDRGRDRSRNGERGSSRSRSPNTRLVAPLLSRLDLQSSTSSSFASTSAGRSTEYPPPLSHADENPRPNPNFPLQNRPVLDPRLNQQRHPSQIQHREYDSYRPPQNHYMPIQQTFRNNANLPPADVNGNRFEPSTHQNFQHLPGDLQTNQASGSTDHVRNDTSTGDLDDRRPPQAHLRALSPAFPQNPRMASSPRQSSEEAIEGFEREGSRRDLEGTMSRVLEGTMSRVYQDIDTSWDWARAIPDELELPGEIPRDWCTFEGMSREMDLESAKPYEVDEEGSEGDNIFVMEEQEESILPDGSEIFTELLHPSLDGPSDGSSQFFVYDTDGRVREFGVADHPDSDFIISSSSGISSIQVNVYELVREYDFPDNTPSRTLLLHHEGGIALTSARSLGLRSQQRAPYSNLSQALRLE